jgi:hypothetical protein
MAVFDQVQGFGSDGMNAALKSFDALSKGAQTAAAEMADYTRRSFADGMSAAEKLAAAGGIGPFMEIQNQVLRSGYEGFVQQATRLGEVASDTAREAFAPLENLVAKTAGRQV